MKDDLIIFGERYDGVTGIEATNDSNSQVLYVNHESVAPTTDRVDYVWKDDGDLSGKYDVEGYTKLSMNGAPVGDGKSRLYIRLTPETGKEITLKVLQDGGENYAPYVDYGDWTIDRHATGAGTYTFNHTYAKYGEYQITVYLPSGAEGNLRLSGYVVGQSSSAPDCKIIYAEDSLHGAQNISAYVFSHCQNVKSASVSVSSAMENATLSNGYFYYCTNLERVYLSDKIISIGGDAFAYCSSLKEVLLPSGLTSVENGFFRSCTSLKKVNIPSGVTLIGQQAFMNCASLETLTIPSGVTTIGQSVFWGCTSMKEYHFQMSSPPSITNNVFTYFPSTCVIYVPYSSDHSILNAYKTASNWSTYADYMQEEPS